MIHLEPFKCILADPPWQYKTYSGPGVATKAQDPYVTIPTDVLCDLQVGLYADDCALFLWVIDPMVEAALKVANAWGFTFKTVAFVWVKSPREHYSPPPGMGHWTRKGTEQCWLFTKGKPKRLSRSVEQTLYCRPDEHSAKPEMQYDRIEALVAGPRLELFARSERPGWTAWGDQVGARDGALLAEIHRRVLADVGEGADGGDQGGGGSAGG